MNSSEHRRRINAVREEAKKDRPCMDCGVTYPAYVMDFDHRDSSIKYARISAINGIEALKREIEKCDVVCANCHRERTHGVTILCSSIGGAGGC